MGATAMRRYVVLTVMLIFGLTSWGHARDKVLVVAEEFPPFVYRDGDRITGVSVDICRAVFERLKVPYEIRIYPWSRAWMMMEKGHADVALDVSYAAAREDVVQYSDDQRAYPKTGTLTKDYLWMGHYVFFVNRRLADSVTFTSYEQLREAGYRIGVNRGYTYEPALLEADLDLIYSNHPTDSFKQLLAGEIDLYVCERTVGISFLRRKEFERDITFLRKPAFSKPYLVAFSKLSDYPNLGTVHDWFYEEVAKMRKSGEYQRIFAAHGTSSDEVGDAGGRKLIFVCEPWKPFEYEEDGKVQGVDVAVVDTIMKRLGVPYEIRLYPWRRAWMMVERGKADAVLSVSYKKEREPWLHFTDEQREFSGTDDLPADFLWHSEYVFFAKKRNAKAFVFESIEQLKASTYRIGTNSGYTYSPEFLAAKLSHRQFNNTLDGFEALVAEEIDLYPMDKTVGLATLKDMGLLDSVVYLPKPLLSKPYLALFCKKSDYPGLRDLMTSFNDELRRMRVSGEYQRLYDRWCYGVTDDPDKP